MSGPTRARSSEQERRERLARLRRDATRSDDARMIYEDSLLRAYRAGCSYTELLQATGRSSRGAMHALIARISEGTSSDPESETR